MRLFPLLLLPMLNACGLWLKGSPDCAQGGSGEGYFADADGDGFGDPARAMDCARLDETVQYVDNDGDCDDSHEAVSPDGEEICDGLNNDCDEQTDEDFVGLYADADGDGFGDPDAPLDCAQLDEAVQYVDNDDDCDDSTFDTERGTRIWYLDPDNDGYGSGEDCELDEDGRWRSGEGCVEHCAPPPEGYGAPEIGDCAPYNPIWNMTCHWTQLTAAGHHTCALRSTGAIECWGDDEYGQVSNTPSTTEFISIDGGGYHTCGLRGDNTIECWGGDNHGQVSDAPTTADFQAVSAGFDHTCGLRGDGAVHCWGSIVDTPTDMDFVAVTAGDSHACGLRRDATVVCWGSNSYGQLNNTPTTGDFLAVSAGQYHTCGLRTDGSIECWGFDDELGGDSPWAGTPTTADFQAVSTGGFHACGLRWDGTVLCWGRDISSPDDEDLTMLASGLYHSCGLHEDGTVTCWGSNTYGQGTPPSNAFQTIGASPKGTCAATPDAATCWGNPSSLPVLEARVTTLELGIYHSYGLRADGTLICWGEFCHSPINAPPDARLMEISAGIHTCGLLTNNTIVCWGVDNDLDWSDENWGQTGNTPTDADFISVGIGTYHSCGVHADLTVKCWGRNEEGQTTAPADNSNFRMVTGGERHTCGLRMSGEVSCWGDSSDGRTAAPSEATFTDIDAGFDHTCGLTSGRTILCWGNNDQDQLDAPAGATFNAMTAGGYYSCGLHNDGRIECWGANAPDDDFGQVTDAPTDADFVAVNAGLYHTCGLHKDLTVTCWGYDRFGQSTSPLVERGITQLLGGDDLVCALLDAGHLVCGGDEDLLPTTDVPNVAMSTLSVGREHACVITKADGALHCWGDNSDGQTEVPADLTTALDVAAGATFTCALSPSGAPRCWGGVETPPTGLVSASITAGYAHACALDTTGLATCWGDDAYGQVSDTPDEPFAAIWAGGWTTCGLRLDPGDDDALGHEVTCWGDDTFGQVSDAPPYRRFVELALGDHHVCGLKPDGLLNCWGSDRFGQTQWPLPSELE